MGNPFGGTQTLDRDADSAGGYAVVDVETSGFHPPSAEIVDIAVVLLEPDGTISNTWTSLVKPGSGNVGATWVHGITSAMVTSAPAFGEIADHVYGLLDGRVVAAHNLAFDSKFLVSQFAAAGIRDSRVRDGVCTLRLAQRHLEQPSHTLFDCCEKVGIEPPARHRALGDAVATAKLLALLLGLRPTAPEPAAAPAADTLLTDFERFAVKHRARLIGHVVPIVARIGSHYAEDVVQVTLTHVWNTWLKQGPPDHPWAYLRTSAERVALRLVERESKLPRVALDHLDLHPGPDTTVTAGLLIDLHRALETLPPRQRQVMMLHLQDVSNNEIATRLGIREGTVAATIHQVRDKLRLAFEYRPRKKA